MATAANDSAPAPRDLALAGEWYRVDEDLRADLRRATALQHRYNTEAPLDPAGARPVLAELLGHLAEDAFVRAPLHVDYGRNISIGRRTFVNYNLTVLDGAQVTIGDDVQIGPNVQLLTATHPIDPDTRRERWERSLPIVIEDDVWLGGGATVLAGVTVGAGSVVGAGAVVTKDVPPGVVVAGSPARVLRRVDEPDAG